MASNKPEDSWDGVYPHCDGRVLHAPGECTICDEYARALQKLRMVWNINFTGHHEEVSADGTWMLPCPAEVARPLSIINQWGGNTPKTHKEDFTGP